MLHFFRVRCSFWIRNHLVPNEDQNVSKIVHLYAEGRNLQDGRGSAHSISNHILDFQYCLLGSISYVTVTPYLLTIYQTLIYGAKWLDKKLFESFKISSHTKCHTWNTYLTIGIKIVSNRTILYTVHKPLRYGKRICWWLDTNYARTYSKSLKQV